MLIALLTDIHGNREAFDACRMEARRMGAQKFVYLGDLIGYGADPCYIVDCVAEDVAQGAIAVMGNHDLAAVGGASPYMNDAARAAIEWTARRLDKAQRDFLAAMPYTAATLGEGGEQTLFVHGDASAPERFNYVTGIDTAERSLRAVEARVTFCGHVHRQQLYHVAPGKPPTFFAPTPNLPTPLARSRRWLAVLGSVGQPRDGNPLACFALYDDLRGTVTFSRVDYDVDQAARKIFAAGLPEFLGERLFLGW
ncbi:metallophosphatase family protein [Rhodoblastus acidophilus]|uniref:Metallophosphatase family protein n=1 Tax=Candidatus Rhodoblastus alkanivorans TaxID=2954117 RepID=A0ABS9Z4K9_9HYPH|nr:metallophosphoesterase family protein [Candidatus Rhodoblastus alkanivorans]MCI4677700.1 metallophosphatase family protein [Candidatus Rhodoblastus alkanivorans]MCI4682568.1 metallophosphatase family protein [Candidatus Rhodoblastus alkanivorans]MDI4639874.1 metallophosphatase family protein [Rhodoblastus acidophilus]